MSGAPALRVLLTRPRQDSEATARLLAEHNIEAVIAPLIEISDIAGVSLDLDGVQALLVTSANGVRALARATPRRDIPVFAVGDASSAVAAQSGFGQVTSADGDVAALAALARDRLAPEDGALMHVAGSAVAGDLAGDLATHGFTVRRAQLYRAQIADKLPAAAQNALNDGDIDAALFYSPRTAAQFAKLVIESGLQPVCRNMFAACLSSAVAEAIADLPFAEIRIAASPDQAALIAILMQ